MTNTQFVRKSGNAKTGPIPTTTSARSTCPSSCPLKGAKGGCYAEAGFYTRSNWDKVDSGERGDSWDVFLGKVRKLPEGQLWRHNVAGDLKGSNDVIDSDALVGLVEANTGKRGFTYTHYPVDRSENLGALLSANGNGFTVNVSCNTPQAALETQFNTGLPVVTLVPNEEFWRGEKRRGNVVRCPAETSDTVSCATCKLCSVADRKDIVGFTAHGSQASKVEVIASA